MWLSIQVEMDATDKTKCHSLILRSILNTERIERRLNHVIAVAFQLLSLFIPGVGREEKKAREGQQAEPCCN